MDIAILLTTITAGYLGAAVLVGATLALFRLRTGRPVRGLVAFVILFVLFAIVNTYHLPAFRALDATITIRNPQVAKLAGVTPDMPLVTWMSVGTLDAIFWLVQTLVAWGVASLLSRQPGRAFRAPHPEGWSHYVKGWPVIGVLIITIMASGLTFELTEYLLLTYTYGKEAWDAGLRVIDNKGHLSDGSELSGINEVILYFGSFLLSVPYFLGSAIGLGYLNMWLHRRMG